MLPILLLPFWISIKKLKKFIVFFYFFLDILSRFRYNRSDNEKFFYEYWDENCRAGQK